MKKTIKLFIVTVFFLFSLLSSVDLYSTYTPPSCVANGVKYCLKITEICGPCYDIGWCCEMGGIYCDWSSVKVSDGRCKA